MIWSDTNKDFFKVWNNLFFLLIQIFFIPSRLYNISFLLNQSLHLNSGFFQYGLVSKVQRVQEWCLDTVNK